MTRQGSEKLRELIALLPPPMPADAGDVQCLVCNDPCSSSCFSTQRGDEPRHWICAQCDQLRRYWSVYPNEMKAKQLPVRLHHVMDTLEKATQEELHCLRF